MTEFLWGVEFLVYKKWWWWCSEFFFLDILNGINDNSKITSYNIYDLEKRNEKNVVLFPRIFFFYFLTVKFIFQYMLLWSVFPWNWPITYQLLYYLSSLCQNFSFSHCPGHRFIYKGLVISLFTKINPTYFYFLSYSVCVWVFFGVQVFNRMRWSTI